jgi:hypothetical protein
MNNGIMIGDIVHYVSHGTPVREDGTQAYTSQCRAAIITAIDTVPLGAGITVSLHVLNPDGDFYKHHLPHGAGLEGGTWHMKH